MNNSSVHFNACAKVFDPGRLFFPFELGTIRGLP
jgi:hypothetical protein